MKYTLEFFKRLISEKAINAKEYGIRLYQQMAAEKDYTNTSEVCNLLEQFTEVEILPVQEYNNKVGSLSACQYTRNGRYLGNLRKTGYVSIITHPLGGQTTRIAKTRKDAIKIAIW